jgi:hypothetical protein
MVADLIRRSEELGRKSNDDSSTGSDGAGGGSPGATVAEAHEHAHEHDDSAGNDLPGGRYDRHRYQGKEARQWAAPQDAPMGYATEEEGSDEDGAAAATAVWCGICGSTAHRSAQCDCWATLGGGGGGGGGGGAGGGGSVGEAGAMSEADSEEFPASSVSSMEEPGEWSFSTRFRG